MQHKGPEFFAAEGLHPLLIVAGSQGEHTQYLGFTAGEKGAAVGSGQKADLAGDRAHLVEAAAVDAAAFFQDHLAR